MSDLVWEDPPPPKNPRGSGRDWRSVKKALMERPGEWAKVLEGVNGGTGSHLRRGHYVGIAEGELEVVTRGAHTDEQGRVRVDVYARYVGNESNGDKP